MNQELRATLIGSTAVLMWATLPLFSALSGEVPPFQLVAMSFFVAFLIGVANWWRAGIRVETRFRLSARVWAVGIVGLFGYHFFYFLAIRSAPVVEASLLNYLWPLLIVLGASFLPGERLRWFHVVGAGIAFAGAALLVTRGQGITLDVQYRFGHLAAVTAAFLWAAYSVISRTLGDVPTDTVGAFCGITAVLSGLAHLAFETTVWPVGNEWWAVLALGLGPVGLAFFTWDHGVKHGNIKTLGVLSYAIPLLSTLLLIWFGLAEPGWVIWVACGLIVGGAVFASGEQLRRGK